MANESRLFYLMGPSGSGKDSLLRLCRQHLREADRCFIAHRYITRKPELAGENHIFLTEQEFGKRARLGAFALQWQAHGYRYGIGSEIDSWLDQGINVLVNGSRAHLDDARQRYHHRLIPLLLQVRPELLEQRLRQRGRETESQIAERVARAESDLQAMSLGRAATSLAATDNSSCYTIDNNAEPELGAQRLLGLIRSLGARS